MDTNDEHPMTLPHVLLCPDCSPWWTCRCGYKHQSYVDMCGDCGQMQADAKGLVTEEIR